MAERFEDTPELFGGGAGTSCIGDIKCEFCGTLHNEEHTGDYPDGEAILNTDFAGLQACECCFLKIENEVLRRMPGILKWYRRLLEMRRKKLERDERLLADACPSTTLETEILCPCGTVHKYRLDLPSGQTGVDFTEPIEITCKRCKETLRVKLVVEPDGSLKSIVKGVEAAGPDGPIDHWPEAGTLCSVCSEPQYQTPSGDSCMNYHGGAPPK